MRIVSQNGAIDLPYDGCLVWLNKEKVVVSPIGNSDSNYTVAIYYAPEKAEKAMKLLREAYIVRENFKEMEPELQLRMLEAVEKGTRLMYGGIFQFPREEDL